jgi:toxin ParE1/3/4
VKVILSPGALADLREIGDFIRQHNLDAAASFVARLKARCVDLGTFPNAGRKRDEVKPGYRSVAEGDYLIFYQVYENAVEILHVIHGKRDLGKALKDESE